MTFSIRPEQASDFPEVYELVETAFESAPHADGDEQDYVQKLRDSPNYISELALVAEGDGELIGHIMLTRLDVDTENGPRETLLLSPLAVAAPYRSRGVGAALVRESLSRAAALQHRAVLVVGDPDYYPRFGFRCSLDVGIHNRNGFDDRNVMACALAEGGLENLSGSVAFPT